LKRAVATDVTESLRVRLEPLFDAFLVYDDKGLWVAPYHPNEYMGYAEATGHVVGKRLNGRVRCINHPRQLKTEGGDFYRADYHGVISTQDGATVLWRFEGYNIFEPDVPPTYLGKALMASWFAADDERYRWLNQTFAVIEALCTGPLSEEDPATERWQLHVFECIHEAAGNSGPSKSL
jgi:hypothetical protein